MKKYIFCLIILALILTSCENDLIYDLGEDTKAESGIKTENDKPFSYIESEDSCDGIIAAGNPGKDSYIYTYTGDTIYFHMGKIYSYNEKTGDVKLMCNDPVCDHSSYECPMCGCTNIDAFYMLGNNIFFREQYMHWNGDDVVHVNQYVKYDLENNLKTVLEEIDEGDSMSTPQMAFYGDYRYYNDLTYDEDENKLIAVFKKQNINTGDFEILKESVGIEITPMGAFDGKIYFYDNPKEITYSYDVETGEEREVLNDGANFFKVGDKLIYRRINDDDSTDIMSCNVDGSGKELIMSSEKNIVHMVVTNQYIYYGINETVIKGAYDYRPDEKVEINAATIYRIKHDGTGKETVFVPTSTENEHFFLYKYFTVQGRYIYSIYQYSKIEDGLFVDSVFSRNIRTICRYDTETGETYYLNVPK